MQVRISWVQEAKPHIYNKLLIIRLWAKRNMNKN